MNQLLIEMATAEDGEALSRALSEFYPALESGVDGHSCVTVELWNELLARDVYATLDTFFEARSEPAVSMTVSLG